MDNQLQRKTESLSRLLIPYQELKRVLQVLRGRDLWQGAQTKCEKLRLGKKGACWCLCPRNLTPASVVYSMGVGEDISFDLALIRRFDLRVHAFDPTPRSMEWLRNQSLPPEFVFHDYGVAGLDGTCSFVPPENPAHVSHTILKRDSSRPAIEVPVRRLGTIMKMLGHESLNLLKMDIEGAEYEVLADMLAQGIKVEQLLVEFHHRWPDIGVEKTKQAIQALNSAGYRIFHVSPGGEEYSFQRTSGS